MEPALFGDGNLRISLACADTFLTPENGLQVSLDGAPIEPVGTNYQSYLWTDTDGNLSAGSAPTDVGFLVAPGHHHLRIESPDCTVDDRDLDVAGNYADFVSGRLPIARDELRGPTGAPNGFALALGAVSMPYPNSSRTGTDLFQTSYALDPASSTGVWLSLGIERRHLAIWLDDTIAWGPMTGRVWAAPGSLTGSQGMYSFTANNLEFGMAARIGARLPLGSLALAAGTGLGGTTDIMTSSKVDTGSAPNYTAPSGPSGASAAWYVPMWAAATIKPSCSWGIQAVASYDIEPLEDGFPGGLEVLAGAEWQPNDACSEPVGVRVRP